MAKWQRGQKMRQTYPPRAAACPTTANSRCYPTNPPPSVTRPRGTPNRGGRAIRLIIASTRPYPPCRAHGQTFPAGPTKHARSYRYMARLSGSSGRHTAGLRCPTHRLYSYGKLTGIPSSLAVYAVHHAAKLVYEQLSAAERPESLKAHRIAHDCFGRTEPSFKARRISENRLPDVGQRIDLVEVLGM